MTRASYFSQMKLMLTCLLHFGKSQRDCSLCAKSKMRFTWCLSAVSSIAVMLSMLSLSSRYFNNNHLPKPSQNNSYLGTQNKTLDEVQAALDCAINLRSRFTGLNVNNDSISNAIYKGNPVRLKNVLRKALKGEDIRLVVLGGSNSAGGFLGADEKSLDGLYFKVFTSWWNKTIGRVTKAFVKEIQLAIGATGSYFYAYCYKTFISEDEKIDIVLIEVSVNDGTNVKPLEQFTRQLLAHPSAPAVLYINLVRNVGPINPSCQNLESFGQDDLARHYEITSLRLREMLCRKKNGKWKAVISSMTASDGKHVNRDAHALVALMMIEYVRSTFKELINDVIKTVEQVEENKITNLPRLLFIERETEALKKPLCWTGKTPDVSKRLHRPSLHLRVINYKGFLPCLIPKGKSRPLRPDAEGGWCARKRFSTLKLSILVPGLTVDDVSSRSVTVMIFNNGGKAVVWLDENKNKAFEFNRTYSYVQYGTIATRVSPGHHDVTVKTVREGMFMFSGVFVGPPDFHLTFP